MKTLHVFKTAIYMALFALTVSCMRQFAETAETEPSPKAKKESRLWTKSDINNSKDWYSIMRSQQDPQMRIVSFIHYQDGHYTFILTNEEANTLGFSDELYTKYTHLVDSLNERDAIHNQK